MTGLLRDPQTGETFRYWERADWGARPAVARNPMSSTREGIFYHHSVTGRGNVPATLRGIQSYHINGRGWLDIGYSFAVGLEGEWDGDLFECRGFWVQGGHTENMNSHSHAICLLGNTNEHPGPGEPPHSPISPRARRAAVAMARVIEQRYGPQRVRCHGDVALTGCPGTEARSWVHAGRPTDNAAPPPDPHHQEDDMPVLIVDGRPGRLSAWLLDGFDKMWIPGKADGGADFNGLFDHAAKARRGGLTTPPAEEGGIVQGGGSPWIGRLDLARLVNPEQTPPNLGGRRGILGLLNPDDDDDATQEAELRATLDRHGIPVPDADHGD